MPEQKQKRKPADFTDDELNQRISELEAYYIPQNVMPNLASMQGKLKTGLMEFQRREADPYWKYNQEAYLKENIYPLMENITEEKAWLGEQSRLTRDIEKYRQEGLAEEGRSFGREKAWQEYYKSQPGAYYSPEGYKIAGDVPYYTQQVPGTEGPITQYSNIGIQRGLSPSQQMGIAKERREQAYGLEKERIKAAGRSPTGVLTENQISKNLLDLATSTVSGDERIEDVYSNLYNEYRQLRGMGISREDAYNQILQRATMGRGSAGAEEATGKERNYRHLWD